MTEFNDGMTEHRTGNLKVSRHAVTRFRERIRDAGDYKTSRRDLVGCLSGAKPKHLQNAHRKRTAYIPLGCCTLVCEHGTVVTVLERKNVDCPICGERVELREELIEHMATRHAVGLGPIEGGAPE